MAAASSSLLDLPFEGEWSLAPKRKYKETILFVHHFGGSRKTTVRHQKLVNGLGFDSVGFNLTYNQVNPFVNPMKALPISHGLGFGARHLWTDQIEAMLNTIPGRKIVYTFSMPSNSAFEAIARRHAEDVAAIICDGGPFLQLAKCTWNLYQHEYSVQSKILRAAYTGLSLLLQGPGTEFDLKQNLVSLPAGLSVLSIRGTEDPLVPIEAIEDFLEYAPQVALRTLTLDGGHHLDGLKKFTDLYEPTVEDFLKSNAT